MATVFYAGADEQATLTNTFMVNNVPTNPTAVTLTVTDPNGAVTTYTWPAPNTITNTGTGAFARLVPSPTPGVWQYTWDGTGAVSDVEHGSWTVLETNLGHLYATPNQIKSRVGIPLSDTASDLELHSACYAASRSVEQWCSRRFWRGPASEARQYHAVDFWELPLGDWNDLVSCTALATDEDGDGTFETTWAVSTYELNPLNTGTGPEPRPYTYVRAVAGQAFPVVPSGLGRLNRVQITGVYGWPAVPAAVAEATRIMASELYKLKDAPFGVAAFGDLGAIRVRQNPIAAQLLEPYRLGYLT